jgi:succinate dehydrogenase/fumarate reductase flavoprotein subunit
VARGAAHADEVVRAVQAEVHPIEKNLFRTSAGIRRSVAVLDGLWADAVPTLGGSDPRSVLRSRETAAMTAVARWCYRAALARAETRGMHLREDRPATSEAFSHRPVTSGFARVEVRRHDGGRQPDPTSGRIPA